MSTQLRAPSHLRPATALRPPVPATPAAASPAPCRPTPARDRSVFASVLVLVALSLGGAWLSVAGGLSADVWEAMGPTGRLSIPIPMMLAQLVAAWLASGRRRRPALVASALLAMVAPVCIISGFYDGGYADPSRTTVHIAYQLVFVAAIAVVGVLAARRFVQLVRRGA